MGFKGLLGVILVQVSCLVSAQSLKTSDTLVNRAFSIAIDIVDKNTHNGILAAGGDYGGEWTRDIAINSWNGVSLIRPQLAEASLWSVTNKRETIGHQYWDKIIWSIAALNHYKVNGDKVFLSAAYDCASKTMLELETSQFDTVVGLFKGPSVFNDGIAGYPEPVFDKDNESSYVLDHKNAKDIKCLSTNCLYLGAYQALAEMNAILGLSKKDRDLYKLKSELLRDKIRKNLYNAETGDFYYLMDHTGVKVDYQEGLGVSFAILFDVVSDKEAKKLIERSHVSPYGIASIYPDFPRFTKERPGRHNNLIWPMVNGFFAKAAIKSAYYKAFDTEFNGLIHLALDKDKGNGDFKEIYNPNTGFPDGGWQSNIDWKSCKLQTWSATAYMDMIFTGICGLRFNENSLGFEPYLPQSIKSLSLSGIKYRNSSLTLNISGSGYKIKSFKINGKERSDFSIKSDQSGSLVVDIVMG